MINLSDYITDNDEIIVTQSSSDPISSDDSFDTGTIWLNTTSNKYFVCTDNTTNNAVWENGGVSTHNDLSSIQGGTSNEYNHLTNAEITDITSLRNNSVVNSLHRHSELVASDGSPDPALSVNSSGGVSLLSGTSINEFSTDGTLGGNSDNAIPTEKAVKTYADNKTAHIVKNNSSSQTIDGGTSTTLTILSNDTGISKLNLYGDSQGTGMLYVGQSSTYGGGIVYNGDDNPNISSTTDCVSFFRRENGTDYEVFRYKNNNSTVIFNSNVYFAGSNQDIMWASDATLDFGTATTTGGSWVRKMAIYNTGQTTHWTNQTNSYNDSIKLFTSYGGSTETFRVEADGDCFNTNNSYGGISDSRIKENVVDCTPKLDDLNDVRVVNYNIIGNSNKHIGVIAQEIEQVFPSIVKTKNDPEADITDLKSVKYSVLVPILIKAIQELTTNETLLRERIETLENA